MAGRTKYLVTGEVCRMFQGWGPTMQSERQSVREIFTSYFFEEGSLATP